MECAMAIQPRGRKRRLVLRIEEEPGPTPETKAKLRPDRLQELFMGGRIDQQQLAAGEEIRAVYDALSALWFRPMALGGPDKTGSGPRHHLDSLPPKIARLHRTRYLPWMRAHEGKRFRGLRHSEILIGVIIDCHAVSDYAADESEKAREAVVNVIGEALDAY